MVMRAGEVDGGVKAHGVVTKDDGVVRINCQATGEGVAIWCDDRE
jgi:hypothetical protein